MQAGLCENLKPLQDILARLVYSQATLSFGTNESIVAKAQDMFVTHAIALTGTSRDDERVPAIVESLSGFY